MVIQCYVVYSRFSAYLHFKKSSLLKNNNSLRMFSGAVICNSVAFFRKVHTKEFTQILKFSMCLMKAFCFVFNRSETTKWEVLICDGPLSNAWTWILHSIIYIWLECVCLTLTFRKFFLDRHLCFNSWNGNINLFISNMEIATISMCTCYYVWGWLMYLANIVSYNFKFSKNSYIDMKYWKFTI